MKFTHYIYIAPLTLLAACSDNSELTGTDDNHPNGAIELRAGIVEGGSAAVTRAVGDPSETYHGKHLALTGDTKLKLQVSGKWKKTASGDPETITQYTTANVGTESTTTITGDLTGSHNAVSCNPVLYWDDYGSAAEDNMTVGRTEGLTIYGVGIDGKTTLPTDLDNIADWTALSWTLTADQTAATGTPPADQDLLISNNVKPSTAVTIEPSNDGTYKFDARGNGKLLEFRHALSKITVNLQAGDGFDGVFGSTTVQLTSNEGTPVNATAWPIITGKVNVTNGAVDIVSDGQGTHSAITMYHNTTATPPTGYHAVHEALVMPGSSFTNDAATILRINADGNIYYVTAEKIRDAIDTKFETTTDANTALATKAGYNYIINVLVNKTDIVVKAAVTDWVNVTAEQVAPKINVTVGYGTPGPIIRVNTFSFYRSLSLDDGYATGESETLKIGDYYRRVSELTYDSDDEIWTMNPHRYWSDHNTHYQFRLVWPNTTTALKSATTNPEKPGETAVQKWRPHVEDKTYDGKNYQVIEIWNDPFQDIDPSKTQIADNYHPYPSSLMIARPEIFDDPATTDVNEQLCTNDEPGHDTGTNLYTGGICATEGVINLTLRYVMSQVEVILKTTASSSSVDLTDAVVEVTNIHTTGDVKLGDREVIPTGSAVGYTLDRAEQVADDPTTTDVNENSVRCHSAIVPQVLTYSTPQTSTNVQFKITLRNGDVYYADVAPIKKTGSTTDYVATAKDTNEDEVADQWLWESGYHYVYTLNISKTAINIVATLADWTTVEAAEDVWF